MQPSKASTAQVKFSLAEVNVWDRDTFTRLIGPVFEHSPWIAEVTWARRPFSTVAALHQELCETVIGSSEQKKLDLIRAHPDLVGRAALAGTLTSASTKEQASAGLDRLSPEEIAAFQNFNRAYHEKFEFPFVICARLNKKEAILEGFRKRLNHTADEEIKTALGEIGKIAQFRLAELIEGPR
jgi:2-oxo-4-hydroxy-4-carboxy-5-ureidoimidazoline decarboxylase